MKKIAVLTTSRADYGLLRSVIHALRDDPEFQTLVFAGGGHLSATQGHTLSEIESDGIEITERLPFVLDHDGPRAAASMAALATLGVSAALERHTPDWMVVLGDRFESLGPVQAAVLHRVAVCHLCGGDVTAGAFDDGFRHAISKLAHLHCVTNEDSANRLRQMGEPPDRVVVTGSSGLDGLGTLTELDSKEIYHRLELEPRRYLLLITYHSETHLAVPGNEQIRHLLDVLDSLPQQDTNFVFMGTNFDQGGEQIASAINKFVDGRHNAVLHRSLGQSFYFNLMRHADAVIGNSSSGLYEAPSFGIATVNIGDRQQGRLRAASVFDCATDRDGIDTAIRAALAWQRKPVVNPYGDGNAAPKIVAAIRSISNRSRTDILRKAFHDHK
jgi:UDP-hydrolysing UDP-N-acetyl-D-glucosamine 2-epimerase